MPRPSKVKTLHDPAESGWLFPTPISTTIMNTWVLVVTFVVMVLLCPGIKQMPIKGWRLGGVRAHHLHTGLLKLFPEPITCRLCILSNCKLKFDSFMFQAPFAPVKCQFSAWGNKLTVWFVLSSHGRKVCFQSLWMDFACCQPPSDQTHASQVAWRLAADHKYMPTAAFMLD